MKNIISPPIWIQYCILILFAGMAVAMTSNFCRPLWADEFLHFVFGACESTADAWRLIVKTITAPRWEIDRFPVNHGQTGVYMLIDYWLLHFFDSNLIALRIPSLFSGAWLFLSGMIIIRARGFGFCWCLVAVFALFHQSGVQYFISEARPYMPLAAASLGTLAYYLTAQGQRTLTVQAHGVVSIFLGVAMHPYFSLYWLTLFLFSFWLLSQEQAIPRSWRSLFTHVNLPLSLAGTVLYFALAGATWARGEAPLFALDPFHFVSKEALPYIFITDHFSFLRFLRKYFIWQKYFIWPMLAGIPLMLIPIFYLIGPKKTRQFMGALLGPMMLLLFALLLSLAIACLSYFREYWILTRQWIASQAICAVAVVWLAAELSRELNKILPVRHLMLCLCLICFTLLSCVYFLNTEPYNTLPNIARPYIPQKDNAIQEIRKFNAGQWVDLANFNVRCGGKVWPIFRLYYEDIKAEEIDETYRLIDSCL